METAGHKHVGLGELVQKPEEEAACLEQEKRQKMRSEM